MYTDAEVATPEKDKDTQEEGEHKDQPKPQAFHRTHSIFLRNLAPTITKQEVEAVSKL
jgi:RNA recognition motif-containing protein